MSQEKPKPMPNHDPLKPPDWEEPEFKDPTDSPDDTDKPVDTRKKPTDAPNAPNEDDWEDFLNLPQPPDDDIIPPDDDIVPPDDDDPIVPPDDDDPWDDEDDEDSRFPPNNGRNNGGNNGGDSSNGYFSLSYLDKPIEEATHIERHGVRFAVQSMTRGNGYDKGVRFTRDTVMPFAEIGLNSLRNTAAGVAAVNAGQNKEFQGAVKYFQATYGRRSLSNVNFNRMTPNDLRRMQSQLQCLLKSNYKYTYWSKNPYIFSRQVKKAILTGVLRDEEAKMALVLAKHFREVNGVTPRKSNFRIIRKFATRTILRSITNDDTLQKMISIRRKSKMVRRMIRKSARAMLMTTRLPIFLAKQARIILLKTNIGKRIQALEQAVAKQVSQTVSKILPRRKAPPKRPKHKRRPNPFRRAWERLPHPIRDVNRRIVQLRGRAFRFITRGKYNPLRIIALALAKLFSAIGAVFSVFKWIIGIILVVYVIFLIFLIFISGGVGGHGFDQNDLETQSKYYKKIEELYEAQMAMIQNYSGEYQNVNVSYEEKKDSEVYNDPLDFKETTNAAEMLSMAQVYFDFELDEADETKVNEYLTGLYNGSHPIETKEKAYYTVENGEKVLDHMDLDVKVTTYYFDELFDVALVASSGFGDSAIAGKSWDVPQAFKQTITYEGRMSWVPTVAKSASNPMRKMYNAWVKNGKNSGTAADGMNGIPCIIVNGQKRYLAAIVDDWADIGDYIDVYLEDGTILPLIMMDVKGCSDGHGYHNRKTCFMYNGVHYGHTANQNGDQTNCSVLEFMKTDNAPSGNPQSFCTRLKPVAGSKSNSIKVTKVVNGGSYLKNPTSPTYVNGSDASSVNNNSATASQFISKLNEYSTFMKTNAKSIQRGNPNSATFAKAKNRIADGGIVKVNCATPAMWALKEMGLVPKATSFYATKATFHGYGSVAQSKLSRVTGNVIGMNVYTAAKQGLLQKGDIISASDFNHTFVYAGMNSAGTNILVYESGGNAKKKGYANVGCGAFEASQYTSLKIAAILRWK